MPKPFFSLFFPYDTDTNVPTSNVPHRVYLDKNTESNNRLFVFFTATDKRKANSSNQDKKVKVIIK